MSEQEPIQQDENQIIAERRAKLAELRKEGIAFPNDFDRTHMAADLQTLYGDVPKEELDGQNIEVSIAGRMMLKRVMGKASFATVQDMGGRIQFYINDEGVGADVHEAFKRWDMGDIIAAKGTLFKTNKGELSLRASELRLLTKSLRPLPEKFHGLTDQEQKYRQRYLDLITNEETRKTFMVRSKVIQGIRTFLVERGYLEVETPMMHPIPGGASARPFTTHHNALDMELFLRIAPGAVSQAPGGGRLRKSLRNQPQFQERRPFDAPQSRIHHDRVLRGLPRLQVPHGPHRRHAARCSRNPYWAMPWCSIRATPSTWHSLSTA